jgi:hypothetical protein
MQGIGLEAYKFSQRYFNFLFLLLGVVVMNVDVLAIPKKNVLTAQGLDLDLDPGPGPDQGIFIEARVLYILKK